MASIETSDGRYIYFDDIGNGPPLLLIGGMISTRQIWSPHVAELGRHFRLITIDNRESGESDPETKPYTVSDMADDGAVLLRALSVRRAHVLGHSMGGFIALNFAVDHPEFLDRLVLVSTSPATGAALGRPAPQFDQATWIVDPVERARRQLRTAAASGYFDAHPEQLEAVSRLMRGNRLDFEGLKRRVQATYGSHDVRDQLGSISAPTMVIHGNADRAIPLENGRLLADSIPHAKLTIFDGVGHFPQLERSDDFHRAVIEFLKSASD